MGGRRSRITGCLRGRDRMGISGQEMMNEGRRVTGRSRSPERLRWATGFPGPVVALVVWLVHKRPPGEGGCFSGPAVRLYQGGLASCDLLGLVDDHGAADDRS